MTDKEFKERLYKENITITKHPKFSVKAIGSYVGSYSRSEIKKLKSKTANPINGVV